MRADRYVDAVVAKCVHLRDCGLWPAEPKVRPAAWLQNFTPEERPIAAVLLDHFVFFGSGAVDRMLLSAFRSLLDQVAQKRGAAARDAILSSGVFTAVEGESPNPTDSGHLFCRKLRQILGLPDAKFAPPELAVEKAANGTPIIFLDDFIGSGDQFDATWKRHSRVVKPESFEEANNLQRFNAYYISLVATSVGYDRLTRDLPMVMLGVSHVIGDKYGISSIPRNQFLPDIGDIPGGIEDILNKYQGRLIVPPYLSDLSKRKYGYDDLGLQLAFDHSTPDATLPIYWAEAGANWTPLVRRT